MRYPALLAAVLTAGLGSASARAAEPVLFTPTGPWTANFAEDSCSLERSFTHDEDTLLLRIRQFVPGERFEITVASETLVPKRRATDIELATSVGSRKIDYFQTFESPEGLKGLVFSASFAAERADKADPAASDYAVYATGNAIDGLTLSDAFDGDLTLRTGSLQEPLRVMASCLDDLLTEWGVDAQAHRNLARKAVPNWSDDWLKVSAPMQRDFGQKKRSDRQEVRLIVDEQGKAIGCRVLEWPADEPISRRLCDALLENAHIPPALNAESIPLKSYYVLELRSIVRVGY